MDKQLIHTQIANLLETIVEQQEIIASHEDAIPQIELDIVLANIGRLYELNRSLEKLAGKPAAIKRVIKKPVIAKSSAPDLFADAFAVEPVAPIAPTPVAMPAQPVVVELMNEAPVVENFIEETVLAELKSIVEEATAVNEPSVTIIEEVFNEEPLPTYIEEKIETAIPVLEAVQPDGTVVSGSEIKETLHDKIMQSAADGESILANRLKKQPIADLRTAIGINEKFLFINEIFNADGVSYSNSIDFINQCKSLAEATVYVNSILKPRFNWALDNKRVADFLELVERRFL